VVKALVDTAIVIDLLRAFPPAAAWIGAQDQLAICQVVWIEVLEGVVDKNRQRLALQMLEKFDQVETNSQDTAQAIELLKSFRLSHGVDGYDCLIAAASLRLDLPLYTLNLKHFTPMIGTLAVKPY
jgi:predicted nucleic acid-binding protein